MIGGQELNNVGRIRRLDIPNGWVAQEQPEDLFSQAWKTSFRAADDSQVELLIYYRGTAIDDQTAASFKAIAAVKPAFQNSEKLTPKEIISLRIMMGFDHSGNNQYTNPNSPDTIEGPVFDLRTAETRRIGELVVLYLSGKYYSGTYYTGIYYQADEAGCIIHQLGINAPSSAAMSTYGDDLEKVLASIEWHAAV